jgi:glutamate-1-semialdehyde 2,1-aminomutase
VVRVAVSVERGEKAYTVQKSEEIFNAAKVPPLCLLRVSGT